MTQPESPLASGPVPPGVDPEYRPQARLIHPLTAEPNAQAGHRCNHQIRVDNSEAGHYEVQYWIYNSFAGVNSMYLYGGPRGPVRASAFASGERGTVVFGVEPLPGDVIIYWVTMPPGSYSTPVSTWTGPDFQMPRDAAAGVRLSVDLNDNEPEFTSLGADHGSGNSSEEGVCTGRFTGIQQIGSGVRATYSRSFVPGMGRTDWFWVGLYGPGDTVARSWNWAPNNSGEVILPGPINRGDYLCYFAQEGPAFNYVALCEYYF